MLIKLLRLVLALVIAAGLAWFLYHRHVKEAMHQVARELATTFQQRFQTTPQVTYSSHVVVEEKKPLLEVAVVERNLAVDYKMESSWLMSEKELHLRGEFKVKAGFNLRQGGMRIEIPGNGRAVRITIPRPRVLSVEMLNVEMLEEKMGWWNRIQPHEREMALRQMRAEAKLQAIQAGVLEESKDEVRKVAALAARAYGLDIKVHVTGQEQGKEDSREAPFLVVPGVD